MQIKFETKKKAKYLKLGIFKFFLEFLKMHLLKHNMLNKYLISRLEWKREGKVKNRDHINRGFISG